MKRLVIHTVVALLFFGIGWVAATSSFQGPGVFRLSIDAPMGETTIKCEGCEFLSWNTEGRLSGRQPTVSLTCADGRCSKVVGAVAATPTPKQIAQR